MYSVKARVGDEKLIKRKLSILEPERKKEKKRDVVFSEIAFILIFRLGLQSHAFSTVPPLHF